MTVVNKTRRPRHSGKQAHHLRLKHPWLAGAGLAACLGIMPVTMAIEGNTLTASDLIASCQVYVSHATDIRDHNVNITLCQAYLQGFLAATNDVVKEENRPSDFILRVLRTRGMRLTERQQKLLYSTYCLPEHESLKTFAAKIARLQGTLPDNTPAVKAVEQTLEQHYRCDQPE